MDRKNFTVDNVAKIVYAKVGNLTEKQLKVVHNYLALGYVLEEKVKVSNGKMEKEKVVAYLEANGTPEQIEKFNTIMNETVVDKKTGLPKLLKSGEPKKKGYVAALQYFKKQFPDYAE